MRVSSVEIEDVSVDVYDIEVDVDHTFIVSGCVLSNSKLCAPLDGKIFPKDKGPRPPLHPNCRSDILPVLSTEPSGTRPYVRSTTDKPLGQMTKKERAEVEIGSVHAKTTYASWFRRQDTEFQRHWLGKTKYDLYKKGGLKLERFSDPRKGKVYTIDELRRRDAEAFKKAGL